MKAAAAVLLLVLALTSASPALAGGTQEAPQPGPQAPPASSMADIPDLVGYVAVTVPNPLEAVICTEEPAGGSWFDIGFQLSRLAWLIQQQYTQLLCALVNLLQAVVNGIVSGVNAVLIGINGAWRFAVFSWLTLRAWLLSAWYLFEVLRDALSQIQLWLFQLQVYAAMLLDLAVLVLEFAGQLALQFVSVVLQLAGLLAWVGGLALGLLSSILAALQGTSVPEQLQDTHPIYEIVRGLGEGIRDSSIGWLLLVVWGMCYVTAIAWLGKFLSAGE